MTAKIVLSWVRLVILEKHTDKYQLDNCFVANFTELSYFLLQTVKILLKFSNFNQMEQLTAIIPKQEGHLSLFVFNACERVAFE